MSQESNMFSCEVELTKFLGSIDLIQAAYREISKISTSSTYDLYKSSSGIQVLAFNCLPEYTTRFLNREFDLVSSETHEAIDAISTGFGSSFSINKAAVELFQSVYLELKQIENKIKKDCPLVVTGQSLGGYLAILFTIWQQHAIDVEESTDSRKTKPTICITFGSPLIGDEALQRAISERPKWKSCFLNVVAKRDRVANFFSSNTQYKPFGTFMFCTETGGNAVFDDQEAILTILDIMASSNAGLNYETCDYGRVLSSIGRKVLYRGVSELGEFNCSSLRAGIILQLIEVGFVEDTPNELVAKIEAKQAKIIRKMKNVYEPTRKLNDLKISMVCMERYMMTRRPTVGYYDSYKTAKSKEEIESQTEIVKHQRRLNQYWESFVKEKNRMPQIEGPKLRSRWLYSGNNYRRIVEPLDIADYYKNGNRNYIENRPNRYKLLEKWMVEDKKGLSPTARTNKAASITEDSCFWAHVEEATISLRNGGSSSVAPGFERFEAYVMRVIHECSVSSDIFLEESSLMKWWNEYKAYRGPSYASEFTEYMNKKGYESYRSPR